MEIAQEEALLDFLDNTVVPFTLDDISLYVQGFAKKRVANLKNEITVYLEKRKIAFKQDKRRWISRRALCEPVPFVISPTKLELANGILIPGHRCVPFANPAISLHHYQFFFKNKPVPVTTTEALPEELYPFYIIFGEEYAPQYIAMESLKNEEAFLADPFEEPGEVSVQTLDMRSIYRMCKFVPGDRFLVRTLDWKNCYFSLERISKEEWSKKDLDEWTEAAEEGFEKSFTNLGPGVKIEEQIIHAYWYGSQRMKTTPAWSLEEFLFEKTNQIEIVPYGIESRFWYVGKEIPDAKNLLPLNVPPDSRFVENMLLEINIPISEYVIISYILDAFFRNEKDADNVIKRIIPPVVNVEELYREIITDYVSSYMDDFRDEYSSFVDKEAGIVRQRAVEMHTAVIEFSAQLQRSRINKSWLPRHTFIILSQIQGHTSSLLEDLAYPETLSNADLYAIDNSLEGMMETYGDLKELINDAMNTFRRSNLTIIHGGKNGGNNKTQFPVQLWRMIQISISGLDIWRRAIIPSEYTLEELSRLILISMDWTDSSGFSFFCELAEGNREYIQNHIKLNEIDFCGKTELVFEYKKKWLIKILMMSSYESSKNETTRFLTGENAPPPEKLDGPRHFARLVSALQTGAYPEKQAARRELGADFVPECFNLYKLNRKLQK